MPLIPRGFDIAAARRHLRRRDPALGGWMRRIGPLEHDFERRFDPVDALARAILYQQLSGHVAGAIVARVEARMPRAGVLDADGIAALADDDLRACGVSRNKIAAMKDLAEKAQAGVVPTSRRLGYLDDEAIVESLTQVRGIGRWTVQMLLMSRLGRPDVLPVHDLGIRKGAQILRELDTMPTPDETLAIGEAWAPYRSLASFYLWRIVSTAQADAKPAKAVKRSQD
ncbi:DNA-3-methyladenine glycosylase family protein [Tahibacter soli]|uniref:DNA-3-methyladenine glycosylase II n=1 Tax=Tahibacter soli TaxID=2983605 RepID=A0A9X4BFX4_9GAMM|nr:DNA-3-methyladenine glycosylase 2 family protein [Tahibacter soli]MDC8011865.1 DNA-3-methyladenine glycosylase 2 family protein [Tahibacter soli]